MKKILLTAAAFAAFAAPAFAADLPARTYKAPPVMVAPIYDWTGFYIGANGGYGWSHRCSCDREHCARRRHALTNARRWQRRYNFSGRTTIRGWRDNDLAERTRFLSKRVGCLCSTTL